MESGMESNTDTDIQYKIDSTVAGVDHAYTVLRPGVTEDPFQVGEVREEDAQAGRNYISDLFSTYTYISGQYLLAQFD